MTNEERDQARASILAKQEEATRSISENEKEIERLQGGGELSPHAEFDTVENEIGVLEHYILGATEHIDELDEIKIFSDQDRAGILENEGLQALRDTYTEEDPEYAGISEEIAWLASGQEEGQTVEQITPEPIEYEAKPPEVDPVYGHPMAVTGGEKEYWDEDIRKSLAAADLLTAQTREAGQTLDHNELMENTPAYKADFEAREISQIGQVQSEEEPSQAQDLDRRAEPEERDAGTAEMFEEAQARQNFIEACEDRESQSLEIEQSNEIQLDRGR